jgi:hypothetical protein
VNAPDLGALREQELLDRVSLAEDRIMWSTVLAKASTTEQVQVARRVLDERATVAPLDGLAAGARLVELVTAGRWRLMRSAREDGASWEQVGATLGMTGPDARAWYGEKIALQERYVPQFHDAARSRAVLDDAANDDPTTAWTPEVPAAEVEASHAAAEAWDDAGAGW